jgi:hypothetical protein
MMRGFVPTVASSPNRHLLRSETPTPARRAGIRKVHEQAFFALKRLELVEQFSPHVRDQPCALLACEAQVSPLVIANQKRIHSLGAIRSITSNHKFLLVLELQFTQSAERSPGW